MKYKTTLDFLVYELELPVSEAVKVYTNHRVINVSKDDEKELLQIYERFIAYPENKDLFVSICVNIEPKKIRFIPPTTKQQKLRMLHTLYMFYHMLTLHNEVVQ